MLSQKVKLSSIKVNKKNPRKIDKMQFDSLVKSILVFPKMLNDLRPIVVDENITILGGNMRYRALIAISTMTADDCRKRMSLAKNFNKKTSAEKAEIENYWAEWRKDPIVDVVKADNLDEEAKKEFIIKDNVSFGEWDNEILEAEFDLGELQDFGLDLPEFADEKVEEYAEEDDFSEEEAAKADTRCKDGDIWQLGRHRLICGDSTKAETYEALMNGERAEISFTSPPYNAGTTPTEFKMKKTAKYTNDDDNKSEQNYLQFLLEFTHNAMRHCEYCFVNIQSLSNNKTALIEYLHELIDVYADTIIWDKMTSQPAMAENVLNSEFEYIHIFSSKANRAVGTKKFRGTISNILHLSKQNKNEFSKIHNATFSVEFASHFINNFCNESVLDAFGGSGTTLIAAEQLGRKCYMIELDPHYCDVIIARWEKLTGQKAEKLED